MENQLKYLLGALNYLDGEMLKLNINFNKLTVSMEEHITILERIEGSMLNGEHFEALNISTKLQIEGMFHNIPYNRWLLRRPKTSHLCLEVFPDS